MSIAPIIAGRVLAFPVRERALERGLEYLFRAHALSPAADPVVRLAAAAAADHALVAFTEVLFPFGLAAARDELDRAAISAWVDVTMIAVRLRPTLPTAPSSELVRALLLAPVANDVGTEIVQSISLARGQAAERRPS